MKTETQLGQPVLSDDEAKPEAAAVQPTARRVAYKSVLDAAFLGILTISALWLFVIRGEGRPVIEAPVTEPGKQVPESTLAKALPAREAESAVVLIDRKLASISDRIDQGFEAQQTLSSVVKREFAAMAESLQAIKAAKADFVESNKELSRRISEATSRLDTLVKEVQALKVVKRQPTAKHKPRLVTTPPFQLDAIDVWDDVTYVAVSQAGRVAFLKAGEQQSGWTVTHIDRLKGQVDFQGPAGQVHSVSLPR